MNKFVCAVALALAAVGCEKKEQQMTIPPRPAAQVTVAAAEARDVPIYLDEIGRTAGVETVTIQPQVTGKVTQIHFKDGADVKKGDMLFSIDPRPFEAILAQAQANIAQQQANVKWAQSELARFSEVQSTGAVATSEMEQKQNALGVALAAQKAAEATLQRAQLDVEDCSIRSPIDGRTGQHLV